METSVFLQSLTAADVPHKLIRCKPINSPTVSNGTIFTPPPSQTAFSGDKETTHVKKNAWPNSVFRTAAPRYEESVCLYIRIKYFLHYTTNPINSFRELWNVIIQGVPFIKGLRLFLYRGCILPTGNKKAESGSFSQGRMGHNPHHAEVDHPLTMHMSVKQALQEQNQPLVPLQRAPWQGREAQTSFCAGSAEQGPPTGQVALPGAESQGTNEAWQTREHGQASDAISPTIHLTQSNVWCTGSASVSKSCQEETSPTMVVRDQCLHYMIEKCVTKINSFARWHRSGTSAKWKEMC